MQLITSLALFQILTPAFHFKILDDFIDVFTEQSQVLVQKMEKESGKAAFNIFPYVTLCTLDIVCGKYQLLTTCEYCTQSVWLINHFHYTSINYHR